MRLVKCLNCGNEYDDDAWFLSDSTATSSATRCCPVCKSPTKIIPYRLKSQSEEKTDG